jgi:predicted acylesterase/phospholipase RssA
MNKTLKLGFAMGGGVSLGTFSGAALSETIKQAVLHAGYYSNDSGEVVFQEYEKVIIDVFAGASAGSMSLAIMLRGLAHQTPEERIKAENILRSDPAISFNSLSPGKKKDLIVAQVVQNLQEDIWINEINIEKLLGTTLTDQENLAYEGGILRRGALEEIAKKYFDLKDAYNSNFKDKRLLSDEVVFGSSLSNLTGLKADSRGGKDFNNDNFAASADAFTSICHKEFRVFHLFFDSQKSQDIKKKPEVYPGKWIRYHNGDKKSGFFGDLRTAPAWSRIVATSIACGAFPFAFEPVVLERFKFEFNEWPEELEDAKLCERATGRPGQLSYPFTYMDGGTFNNEPVREAFRMAAFLDAKDKSDNFDRLIVFVDPSVGAETVDFRVPVHKEFTMKKPRNILGNIDGYDLIRKSTLDRLAGHFVTILTMIINESRVNENDKIAYISELFDSKGIYNDLLSSLIEQTDNVIPIVERIAKILEQMINLEKLNELLPQGALTLAGELRRVVNENQGQFAGLEAKIDSFEENGIQAVSANDHLLVKAMFAVFIDRLLNLTGKSKQTKIMAIAPTVVVDGIEKIQKLPGDYLMAFAGFTSKLPNIYAANLARHCTARLMKKLKMLKADSQIPPYENWKDQKPYVEEYRSKLLLIHSRIDSLFTRSKIIDIFPGVDSIILNGLSKAVKNALDDIDLFDDPFWSFLFKIEVDSKNMEIDGTGSFNDTAPQKIDGRLFLITELYYFYGENTRWEGVNVQDGMIVVNKDGFFSDRKFCKLLLPGKSEIEIANKMPNPIFEYRILTAADAGKDLPASGWVLKPGVRRIDEDLLG